MTAITGRQGMTKENIEKLDIYKVLKHLPHRYPFLLIDRVIECVPGERLLALKNVSYNEPYFQGHFPHRPVLPGVLVVEALAQATGILSFRTMKEVPNRHSLYYLVGIDKARFKRPVEPGDQLLLRIDVVRAARSMWKFQGIATVDGKTVCTADLMCAERDVEV